MKRRCDCGQPLYGVKKEFAGSSHGMRLAEKLGRYDRKLFDTICDRLLELEDEVELLKAGCDVRGK